MPEHDLSALAAKLSEAQRAAIIEGRVHDCPYNHPIGTKCPNCADWPFKKGGAAGFVLALRDHLNGETQP